MDDSTYHAAITQGRKKNTTKKIFMILFILLLGIIPAIFLTMKISTLFYFQKDDGQSITPTEIAFPTDMPTQIPTPAITKSITPTVSVGKTVDKKTGLNKAALTVRIENGSGKVGAANAAAQLLKDAGYIVVGTQNADNFSYLDVVISIKAEKSAYLPVLRDDLAALYTIAETKTDVATASAVDAVVIIGK